MQAPMQAVLLLGAGASANAAQTANAELPVTMGVPQQQQGRAPVPNSSKNTKKASGVEKTPHTAASAGIALSSADGEINILHPPPPHPPPAPTCGWHLSFNTRLSTEVAYSTLG